MAVGSVDQGTTGFVSRLLVSIVSVVLLAFYVHQYRQGRCLIYPIYVQAVTAAVYCVAAFENGSFINAHVELEDGVRHIALGRYLAWMITCPPMLMGFFQTIGLLGPRISFTKINFIVTRDLITMAFGIAGTFQTNRIYKGIFIAIALVTGTSIVVDTVLIELERRPYYVGHLWRHLVSLTSFFFFSWAIFPILYFLGPAVFDVMNPEIDVTLHAMADFFGKNCFGLLNWNFRYNVLYPYLEGQAAKAAVSPHNPGGKSVTIPSGVLASIPRKELIGKKNRKGFVYIAKVLLVDADIGYQRLFQYVGEECGVEVVPISNLLECKRVLQRELHDEFDAVLINMATFYNEMSKVRDFNKHCRNTGLSFAIIGYDCGLRQNLTRLYKAANEKGALDGILERAIDPVIFERTILEWKESASLRRVIVDARKALRAHQVEDDTIATDQNARLAQVQSPQVEDSHNGEEEASLQEITTETDVAGIPSAYKLTGTTRRMKQFALNRRGSTAALLDSDDPFRTWYDPAKSPGNPQYDQSDKAIDTCCYPGCLDEATMACGACEMATYCSIECLQADWQRPGGHERTCRGSAQVDVA
eukprot:CAMPEP_0202072278 /NCGR_PEP_ID=MMETSP0964-20121228/2331_1 /ASSEMBLY_ACC=CAM_ASM_000500 /TAXON_ID=4773 /ORGANISM="Schizochytrium aggregatum, Strain ATCC28209" /LENGTH=587 /DNA_ID=CAMNT_0048639301 /DNA_START=17 /DNA_END=1780 /DNA_ORIENTATION=-